MSVNEPQAVLADAQRIRRKVLERALALASSGLSAREFGQAVETLQQQAASQLAACDEQFAALLDGVSWPGTDANTPRPARRLASPWLAHGLMMAAGCGDARTSSRDANVPVADAGTDGVHFVLPDAPVPPADRPAVEVLPIPHETCATDGGQTVGMDASCSQYTLEDAVRQVLGCNPQTVPGGGQYAVVIDCEGRVTELLGLPDQTPLLAGDARQAWLDALANDRWPCFAGQSVQFTCMVCLFP